MSDLVELLESLRKHLTFSLFPLPLTTQHEKNQYSGLRVSSWSRLDANPFTSIIILDDSDCATLDTRIKQQPESLPGTLNPDSCCIVISAGNRQLTTHSRHWLETQGVLYACVEDSIAAVESQLRLIPASESTSTTCHGVLMDVHDIGILITGLPDIGKSELALELVTRGHKLIADDVPAFYLSKHGLVTGYSPKLLYGFLEVRGLGVLDVRAIFGENAISKRKILRLVIQLKKMGSDEIKDEERLHGDISQQVILGQAVDCLSLPVAPGRNLAVLVEIAARNHHLKLQGYDGAQRFIELQSKEIEKNRE